MVNLCFDDVISSPTLGYPNLASPGLAPDQFDSTWPRVIPLRLQVYFSRFALPYQVHDVMSAPVGSWYPVALGWHDFSCDYFRLMSDTTRQRLRRQEIRALFYYHEGDNPASMIDRFNSLCRQHDLPLSSYLLVSANTAAGRLSSGYYFPDHEYFFQYINRRQSVKRADDSRRPYEFTALNRTHKWWRASCMADLVRDGLLENSIWSYNTSCLIDDREEDNPIELDIDPTWREAVKRFVSQGPYWCDSKNDQQHNDHRHVNELLHQQSYCHLVIETLFDADQSDGAFLTEKTYKCLKYGQPFVIIGTSHSLQALRDRGYRVFDQQIDNSYDLVNNNTQRWLAIKDAITKIRNQDMHQWYMNCLDDVRHNQEWFIRQAGGAIEDLWRTLATDSHAI